ncbi:MAG: site-2 protease family protein [Deltaproteobacteria bacterium]|nr:site-2 protease family protein [Deltaproteobacteria bacterium]
MDASLIQSIAVWALPVLVAVILHEVAHGYVANLLGDPTAKDAGRLTLNPLPHIDPMGTIALPLFLLLAHAPFLFGYARPVPVRFGRLRNPKRDMVFVAAAGPVTNLILATLSAGLVRISLQPGIPIDAQSFLAQMAIRGVVMNVGLAVFNLLPIPPLDGGRVATGLLPMSLAVPFAKLERYGMLIIVLLLATDTADRVMRPVVRALLHMLL